MSKVKLRLALQRPALPRWEPEIKTEKPASTLEGRFLRLRDFCEANGFRVDNFRVEHPQPIHTRNFDFGRNVDHRIQADQPVKLTLFLVTQG